MRVRKNSHARKITIILATIVGLLIFYPLAGCTTDATGESSAITKSTTQTAVRSNTSTPSETSTPVVSTPVVTGSSSSWKLTWSDEFDGKAGAPPDPNKWTAKVGGGGWGNQQLDYDTDNQNAYQDGQGNLVLEARQENPGSLICWYGPCKYTSAQITTEGHFSYTYGLLEARMKIPSSQGIWSSFWLLGDNCAQVGWPTCGEVDVMENINSNPGLIYGTVHGPGYSTGTYQLKSGKFADNFHVFGLQWDPNHLYFMVDGTIYHTVDRNSSFPTPNDWVYNHPFNIVLDLPVGGVWPGSPDASTVFPQKMYISYIHLYTSQ